MVDGPGRPRLVAALGRARRWHPCSYPQAWLVATVAYLAAVSPFWFIGGWLPHRASSLVVLVASWLGVVCGSSYDLHRRRNGGRVSEAKPFGRLPRSR